MLIFVRQPGKMTRAEANCHGGRSRLFAFDFVHHVKLKAQRRSTKALPHHTEGRFLAGH
jgi:hypothetical protein